MSPSPTADRPTLITERPQLTALIERVKHGPRVALDTEAASFHRYVDRVYLIQISSDAETALIDPLAVDDLGSLGALMADPGIETIFHDADYDLRILDRDYGFRARRIWDTRVAAQLAGEAAVGLGALLAKYFGLTLSKKLQRADWSRRPLTDEMIAYAAADTAHLPALRDVLADQLRALGRLSWAEEEFARLEQVRVAAPDADQAFLRLKGAKALPPRSLAVLRPVWEWRERAAAALDRAPFRVLGNDVLITLAREAPATLAGLRRPGGVPDSVIRRYGADLIAAIAEGRETPEEAWPRVERQRRPRPDPAVELRFQRLRDLRARHAERLGLAPGLVCPNATLQAIARAAPATGTDLDPIDELRSWQREALGDDEIVAAVVGG